MKTFTEQTIQKLTNEKSFIRGEKYYKQGRVTEYTDKSDLLEALVIGTDNYKVRIDLTNLDINCNCPAFRGDLLCKHQVAVLLTKIHGEVEPDKKPKVKKSSYGYVKEEVISRKEIRKILEDFSKNELVDHTSTIIENNPDLFRHFTEVNKKYSKQDYKKLQKEIRAKFRGVSYRSNWNSYVNRLDSIYYSVIDLVKFLSNDEESCKFLLEQAYWIEEKQLTRLDDSDGIISGLELELTTKAIQYLNAEDADLSAVLPFTARKSSFDYGINIVNLIYKFVTNKNVLRKLGEKIERTMFKKDSDFNFDNKYLHPIYLKYLADKDFEKFQDLVKELYKQNISIFLLMIKVFFEKGKYKEVVKIGWNERDRWDINDLVKKSLIKLERWDEYTNLLKTELLKNFELSKLKELKSAVEKHGEKGDWERLLNEVKKVDLYKDNAVDLALFLKDYDKVYKILTTKPEKDYRGNINTTDIENIAIKLLIIHPDTAMKMYKFLIGNELEKFKGYANRYDKFFDFLLNIRNLGDEEYVEEVGKRVVSDYPTKKKLVERIKIF